MGEVYRARDTRLDREVAIKVLPSHVSENPEFRARFEREAKTISGLQHPNICVLYDVGRQDSVDFLVMEYLRPTTLSASGFPIPFLSSLVGLSFRPRDSHLSSTTFINGRTTPLPFTKGCRCL
jgi:serine/threonine protein kinase